ncbi:transcriptional regulator, arsr family protein [Halogeometricum pallidum JCM 14848]|uniref:Transcriptional regulator, arsr family protein n=1 Tax=Halogeometricum pallidum JCM 14848 TaxID=1227487 RepID=M0DHJ8_HALPD|nr:winged helix-turn-helix domain-containing protein [Halogeometricum pallidum]ELZ34197.1 transcriptional regulator, arsr family protein [Halogeometricum pallidum JCM 14848]
MARLLPSSSNAEVDASPRVIGLDDDDADGLLSALSSATARRVLSTLHEEPANPAALADAVDTSLQNVQYHLGRLEDAGAVEVVDTVYSEKGREMKVYAPSDRPLVVVATDREGTTGLRAALRRLLAAVGVVGVASLLVQWAAAGATLPFAAQSGSAGGDAATMEATRVADDAATAAGLPPGLLFFLGGLSVLLVWSLAWYLRRD